MKAIFAYVRMMVKMQRLTLAIALLLLVETSINIIRFLVRLNQMYDLCQGRRQRKMSGETKEKNCNI